MDELKERELIAQNEHQQSASHYCSLKHVKERTFSPAVSDEQARLIVNNEKKWVNGTILKYYFFDQPDDGEFIFVNGQSQWVSWIGSNDQKNIVINAFKAWKDIGIGLKFEQVDDRNDADIRIGFMRGDGSWSYIGRDILRQGKNNRTMNFGWRLNGQSGLDTAMHEIGHTLGFPHEHQNPNAGIVWDEEAVYASLARPPNNWDRQTTYHNIIRKISPDTIQGSSWDANSIMHYPFAAGMIRSPENYNNGLNPQSGLSERDKLWVRNYYPPLNEDLNQKLIAFNSIHFALKEGQQINFTIEPSVTRNYTIKTFGIMDTVMVLFEDKGNENLIYLMADDDSGEDYNASITTKLIRGCKYILRLRLYYSNSFGDSAVMMW